MHPINFIAKHINFDMSSRTEKCDTICAITGIPIKRGSTLKKYTSGNFTGYDTIRYESKYISEDVLKCTTETILYKGKFSALRYFNYIVTIDKLDIVDRYTIYNTIKNPPQNTPFIITLSYNQKKQTATNSIINTNTQKFKVTTDTDGLVEIDLEKLNSLFPILEEWYSGELHKSGNVKTFFTKTEILSGIINPKKIEAYGITKFLEENSIIDKYRNTKVLKLLTYCIPAKELQNA